MKNSLILLLSVFVLSACGGKKVVSTSFVLNAGALLSGTAANGGVAIVGTNGSDKFSVGLTPAQAQNFSLELSRGSWQFHAVAWLGGAGLMTGETRCGSATASVEGTEVSISLTLDGPTCDTTTFSSAATQDTGEIFPTFKKVTLNSCLNPVGPFVAANDCDGTQLYFLPGESVSTRLMIPGASNFGASLPSLQSGCINLVGLGSVPPNLKSGVMLSDVRLPAGGTVPFPAAIIGYENGNCSEITTIYPMPDGVTGSQGVGRIINPSNGTRLKVSFADNYFGVIGSPFYQGHVGNYVKVPVVKCTTLNCYDVDSTSRNDYSSGRDPARGAVWSLLGSRNQISPNDWGWIGYATTGAINVTANTGTATFTLISIVDGLEVSANIQNDSAASVNCSAGVDNIHMEIRVTSSATDPASLATLINGTPACNTYITASSAAAPATPTTHTWTTGGLTFSGLTPSLKKIRRDEGSLGDVKNMLLGPMSAILHKNGIQTGASLCTATGTFNEVVHGDAVSVSIGAASGSAVVADFSNSTGNYERKILLTVNGVAEEAFYFNCDSAGASATKIYDGAYVSIHNEDSGALGKLQIFWNIDRAASGQAWIEQTSTWQSSSEDYRSHSLLRVNTTAATDWDLWHVEGSDSHSNYISLVGRASAGILNLGYHSNNLSTSDVVVPVHTGTPPYVDTAYLISTGNVDTVNVNTRDVATAYGAALAPEIVVDRTIDDVMNGVISFWPLSN